MRKVLFMIGLGVLNFSCSTQKKITYQKPNPPKKVPQVEKTTVATAKPLAGMAKNIGNAPMFYTQNIADIRKNDNTASYGSVVSAQPKGYKISYENFPAISQNFRQRYLILHYTALDNEASVRVLTQRGVSAHYLVSDTNDQNIWQLVDENKRAYHAGVSYWRNTTGMNDNSIGIEIVNKGYTTDPAGNKRFYPFPEYQFRKVAALVKDIVMRYNIPPTQVLAHSDIAPVRKQDPGPFFPWKRLYDEYQVGMWYDEGTKQNFYTTAVGDVEYNYNVSSFIFKVQTYLRNFGYDIAVTGIWDAQSKKVIEAFQYHFRPERCDGILDPETWAILQALLAKYPK